MRIKIYVLKRSNGFIGIYKNGTEPENLVSNFPSSYSSAFLFEGLKSELDKCIIQNAEYDLIFTEAEEMFVHNLPSLSNHVSQFETGGNARPYC